MRKLASEIIQEALSELKHSDARSGNRYDPVKAHQYYEQHKHLKGRAKGSSDSKVVSIRSKRPSVPTKQPQTHSVPPALEARVQHLEARLHELRSHLQSLLASKTKSKSTTKKHQTTAQKQKQAAARKKYNQQHKTQLAQQRKAAKAGGSTAKSVSSMTAPELRAAIQRTEVKLHAAVANARAAANRSTA